MLRNLWSAPYWFSDSRPPTLWAAPSEATTSRCGPWRGLLPFSTCPPSLSPSCTPLPSQMRFSAPPLLCISTGVRILLGIIKIWRITYGGDPNTFQYLNGENMTGCRMFGIQLWWLEYWTEKTTWSKNWTIQIVWPNHSVVLNSKSVSLIMWFFPFKYRTLTCLVFIW